MTASVTFCTCGHAYGQHANFGSVTTCIAPAALGAASAAGGYCKCDRFDPVEEDEPEVSETTIDCDDCGHPFGNHHDPFRKTPLRCDVRVGVSGKPCGCNEYRIKPRCSDCRHYQDSHEYMRGCTSKFCSCPIYEFTAQHTTKGNPMTQDEKVLSYTLPDGREYIPRALGGFPNDVEGLQALRAMGKHTLLLGDPGSGKTALLMAAFPDAENEIGHDKLTAQDMLWRPRIDPSSEHGVTYDPSPLNRAATQGKPFYFDEIMRANADALTPLFSAMDGRGFIVGGNLDGTDLPVAPGFCVIGASNPMVRGAFLPDAIASRFHILTVETSEDLLKKFELDDRLLVIWRNLSATDGGETWRPSIRELLAAQSFIDAKNMQQAAYALTGWRIPARDRKTVANVIGPILGVRVTDLGGIIK